MLNAKGEEVPDPTPLALPVGFEHPPSMVEMIRMYVRREVSQLAAQNDAETFEESEDFDVDDEFNDPKTEYEAVFDPPVPPSRPAVEPAEPVPASAAGSSAPASEANSGDLAAKG